jgi:hypothetical protein
MLAEGVGFEPTREREPPGGFQDRCLKPLGHPSFAVISTAWRQISMGTKGEIGTQMAPNFFRLPRSSRTPG